MNLRRKSSTMARITKTDTKPELLVRRFLFGAGFRFRLYDNRLPGTPDIVMPRYATLVQVNGCFWHGHANCRLFREPRRNREYWIPKINGNVARDVQNQQKLGKLGWRVLTVWECELTANRVEQTMSKL